MHRISSESRLSESARSVAARLADAVSVIIPLYLTVAMYLQPSYWTDKYTIAVISGTILFYLFSRVTNLYQSVRLTPFTQFINLVLLTWLGTVLCLLVLGYIFKITHEYSRIVLGVWLIATPMLQLLWRAGYKSLLRVARLRGYDTRSAVIVGTDSSAIGLCKTITEMPWLGYKIVGFIDKDFEINDKTKFIEGIPVLGDFDSLIKLSENNEIDVVYIALPLSEEVAIANVMQKLSDTTVSVFLVPGINLFQLMHSQWVMIGSIPAISVVENTQFGIGSWLKRLEDIIVSLIAIILFSLPMMIIAILVKLSSPGPVFYKQARYGLMGEKIIVWKFRSMKVVEDDAEFKQATRDDERITPVGRFIRKTSLDELPQFFNVLHGDMSVVGPRPHAVAHNEEFRGTIWGYMMRHMVKPGITGWAQIHGLRGETETKDKMELRIKYDLEYINTWSLWLDFRIIFITPVILFKGENAY
jgi:putative colanic acid biosynthesis UDP-glucose lipid carrier transferase